VGLEVIAAANIKIMISWDMTPCTLVDRYIFKRNLGEAHPFVKLVPFEKLQDIITQKFIVGTTQKKEILD
jgi:hypothetical protein